MIRIKTKEEIELLREGGKKLAQILEQITKKIKPGVNTAELETFALQLIKEAGGRAAFKGHEMPGEEPFPSALCTSINEEIVHSPAIPGRDLKFGDIIGIDIGMEYPVPNKTKTINEHSRDRGFYTDMAVTVIVGEVDKRTEELVKVTKKSLILAIKNVKPGNTLNDIGSAVQEYVESKGFSVVRDLVGHGVGHEVHESPQVPNFKFSIFFKIFK